MRRRPRNKYGAFGTRKALGIYFAAFIAWGIFVLILAAILHFLGIPLPTTTGQ